MSREQSTTPAYELVYATSKKPTALHASTEKECWSGHMRAATAEELKELAGTHCKHCVRRVAALQASTTKAQPAKASKPTTVEPLARPTKPTPVTAGKKVRALVDGGLAGDATEARTMLVDMGEA